MNTVSNFWFRAASLAALLLAGCSLESLQGKLFSPTSTTTQISELNPQPTKLTATVFIEAPTETRTPILTALQQSGYKVVNDPTLALWRIVATPSNTSSEDSTSAPLVGLLRKTTRTDTYDILYTLKDTQGNLIHQASVVGFGEEQAGIYPHNKSRNQESLAKAKSDALAQLVPAIMAHLKLQPWRALVMGQQDSKTVILGFDATTRATLHQRFWVQNNPEQTVIISGFDAQGRALAATEKGSIPQPGQWLVPAP